MQSATLIFNKKHIFQGFDWIRICYRRSSHELDIWPCVCLSGTEEFGQVEALFYLGSLDHLNRNENDYVMK